MRILHVTEQRYRSSGVSVWCVELCERLAEIGHDVKLALQLPNRDNPYPVKNHDLLIPIETAISEFEKSDWDIVHINGIWNWPYHQIARLARKQNIPIFWSPHGSLTPWAISHKRLKKFIAWLVYQKRDLLVADTLHVTAQSEVADLERLGLNNRMLIVPLGVKPRYTQSELMVLKQQEKGKRIMFLSRINPKKGIDNLIRAWRCVKDDPSINVSEWEIDIFGEEDTPGYLSCLQRLCCELSVSEDVHFRGVVYGVEKEMAFAQAEVFVLPTHSENFAAVVVEALAAGTPVITTRNAPWIELVDNACGWWIEDGVEALAKALKEAIVAGENKLSEMGMRGRRLVERKYSWMAVADEMVKGYERALHR